MKSARVRSCESRRCISSKPETGLPSSWTMRPPGSTPATAAGLFGPTGIEYPCALGFIEREQIVVEHLVI